MRRRGRGSQSHACCTDDMTFGAAWGAAWGGTGPPVALAPCPDGREACSGEPPAAEASRAVSGAGAMATHTRPISPCPIHMPPETCPDPNTNHRLGPRTMPPGSGRQGPGESQAPGRGPGEGRGSREGRVAPPRTAPQHPTAGVVCRAGRERGLRGRQAGGPGALATRRPPRLPAVGAQGLGRVTACLPRPRAGGRCPSPLPEPFRPSPPPLSPFFWRASLCPRQRSSLGGMSSTRGPPAESPERGSPMPPMHLVPGGGRTAASPPRRQQAGPQTPPRPLPHLLDIVERQGLWAPVVVHPGVRPSRSRDPWSGLLLRVQGLTAPLLSEAAARRHARGL